MINKRLSDLSCNEEEYEKAKPLNETALNESGYKKTMPYTKTTTANNRNRARNVRWLLKKYFPRDHKLYRIFNRNTLKLSYSCMRSMSTVIKQHNYKILSTTKNIDRL